MSNKWSDNHKDQIEFELMEDKVEYKKKVSIDAGSLLQKFSSAINVKNIFLLNLLQVIFLVFFSGIYIYNSTVGSVTGDTSGLLTHVAPSGSSTNVQATPPVYVSSLSTLPPLSTVPSPELKYPQRSGITYADLNNDGAMDKIEVYLKYIDEENMFENDLKPVVFKYKPFVRATINGNVITAELKDEELYSSAIYSLRLPGRQAVAIYTVSDYTNFYVFVYEHGTLKLLPLPLEELKTEIRYLDDFQLNVICKYTGQSEIVQLQDKEWYVENAFYDHNGKLITSDSKTDFSYISNIELVSYGDKDFIRVSVKVLGNIDLETTFAWGGDLKLEIVRQEVVQYKEEGV